MLLTRSDGEIQQRDSDAPQLEAAGYHRCYTNRWKVRDGIAVPCPFWISPEAVEAVKTQAGGYYTCPVCQRSYDLLADLPWHGSKEETEDDHFAAGGGTRIGIKMRDQGQIGEDLVQSLGELPGYGPITWWSTSYNSPLDGATKDWGIEVKTIGYDATHHRFVPGRVKEKEEKNAQAASMGKKGVLGVLVMLDYRRSVADIFVKEMPLEKGPSAFRTNSGQHLVEEVPFRNPFMDPNDPAPHKEDGGLGGDYKEDMPF